MSEDDGQLEQLLKRVLQLEAEVSDLRAALDRRPGPDTAGASKHALKDRDSAVKVLRNLLVRPEDRIRLADLIQQATGIVVDRLRDPEEFPPGVAFGSEELERRIKRYEAVTDVLAGMFAEGAFWGAPGQEHLWSKALERIANSPERGSGLVVWISLRLYPALFSLYAAGVSAVAADNYGALRALFLDVSVRDPMWTGPAVLALYPGAVVDTQAALTLPSLTRHHTPVSDLLHTDVRAYLRANVPEDRDYDRLFDRFEYLLGLTFLAHLEKRMPRWAPVGRFGWRRSRHPDDDPVSWATSELARLGAAWGLARAGLVGEGTEAISDAMNEYHGIVAHASTQWFV